MFNGGCFPSPLGNNITVKPLAPTTIVLFVDVVGTPFFAIH
jgi:hypothetical protein